MLRKRVLIPALCSILVSISAVLAADSGDSAPAQTPNGQASGSPSPSASLHLMGVDDTPPETPGSASSIPASNPTLNSVPNSTRTPAPQPSSTSVVNSSRNTAVNSSRTPVVNSSCNSNALKSSGATVAPPQNSDSNSVSPAKASVLSQHSFSVADMDPYIKEVLRQVKLNWHPPRGEETRTIAVEIKIYRNGMVSNLRITKSGGLPEVDKAAQLAVETTAPLPELPSGALSPVDMQINLDYKVHGNSPEDIQKSIDALKGKFGDNTKDLGAKEMRLGSAYCRLNSYESAKQHFLIGLDLLTKGYGADSPDSIQAMQIIGRDLYCRQKDYEHAKTFFDHALSKATKIGDQQLMGTLRAAQAEFVEIPQNHMAAAEQLLKTATKALEASVENRVTYHSVVGQLVQCYVLQKKYDAAIAQLNHSIELGMADGVSGTAMVVDDARTMAQIYLAQHDKTRAIAKGDQTWSTYEKKYGKSSEPAFRALQSCVFIADESGDEALVTKYGALLKERVNNGQRPAEPPRRVSTGDVDEDFYPRN